MLNPNILDRWLGKQSEVHPFNAAQRYKGETTDSATTWTVSKKYAARSRAEKEYTLYGSIYRIPENTNDRKQVIGCLGWGARRGWDRRQHKGID